MPFWNGLVGAREDGLPLSGAAWRRAWRQAREAVLEAHEIGSPLARSVGDLRGARISTWLKDHRTALDRRGRRARWCQRVLARTALPALLSAVGEGLRLGPPCRPTAQTDGRRRLTAPFLGATASVAHCLTSPSAPVEGLWFHRVGRAHRDAPGVGHRSPFEEAGRTCPLGTATPRRAEKPAPAGTSRVGGPACRCAADRRRAGRAADARAGGAGDRSGCRARPSRPRGTRRRRNAQCERGLQVGQAGGRARRAEG